MRAPGETDMVIAESRRPRSQVPGHHLHRNGFGGLHRRCKGVSTHPEGSQNRSRSFRVNTSSYHFD